MKLFIDASDAEEIAAEMDGKMYKTKSRKDKSQRLLPFIEKPLIKKREARRHKYYKSRHRRWLINWS